MTFVGLHRYHTDALSESFVINFADSMVDFAHAHLPFSYQNRGQFYRSNSK
jgi:hypothetical protein